MNEVNGSEATVSGKSWEGKLLIADYRCPNCGRLLFRAHIPNVPGFKIFIKCTRSSCGITSVFQSSIPSPKAIRAKIETWPEPVETDHTP